MAFVLNADATRARQLVNKQALSPSGEPLPWPSVRADGTTIPGSVGTTSIQDATRVDGSVVYEVDQVTSLFIERALNGERSRLTAQERQELSEILTRTQ